ncbi:hypothetical protein [Nostoc sp. DedQUE07]|uniref:hypothetical protein n=1 Tax=Nostoc sp. DedQUE07 TaxID=3075392 RepID=UPI002AD4A129|nr:hypothetical protein [Nostoc sp. DedQUE07]MDZ8131946.1 hypothetical protein [Nostoc sp. DedQUE07]
MRVFQIEQKQIDETEGLSEKDLGKWCYSVEGEALGFFNTSKEAIESQLNIVKVGKDDIDASDYLTEEHLGKWAYVGGAADGWKLKGFYGSQAEAIEGYKLSRSI